MRLGTDLQADGDYARAQAALRACARRDRRRTPSRTRRRACSSASRRCSGGWAAATDARDVDRPRDRAAARGRQPRARADHGPQRQAADAAGQLQRVRPRRARGARGRRAAPARSTPRGIALNALGVSLIQIGDIDEGRERLREAIAHRRSRRATQRSAYVNLADALHVAGRSREALEVVARGARRCMRARAGSTTTGSTMTVGEIEWELGDWASSRARTPRAAARPQRHDARVRRAAARGDRARRRRRRGSRPSCSTASRRPSPARASRSSSAGTATCARSSRAAAATPRRRARALDDALDAIEFCSEDRPRIARLAQTGVSVEADAAERARDVGDADAERLAIAGAEAYLSRSEACADPPRPVEQARLATARAELARARGASDPQAYADAAAAWRAAGRPYPAALDDLARAAALAARRRPRRRAGRARRGPRDRASASARRGCARRRRASPGGRGSSADGEPVAGARRRRGRADDPFGLTPRERQVLELLARGATNREIGAELFMAEKTASVHVSRILAKLDVRTRTEAAAVAYRLGLAA